MFTWFLNPKNSLLTALAILLVAAVVAFLFQRTSLVKCESNYKESQMSLATQTTSLDECQKNVKALTNQYDTTEQITQRTQETRKRIQAIVSAPKITKKEKKTVILNPLMTTEKAVGVKTAEIEVEVEKEIEYERKKLDDLFALSNTLILGFNSVHPHAGGKK